MSELNKLFWGKKDDSAGIYKWLPLYQHLTDTGKVMGFLWEHWLNSGQRNFIKETLNASEDVAKSFCVFLGKIHDIGKASPTFQTISLNYSNKDIDKYLIERLETAGFTGLSNFKAVEPQKSHHTVMGETLLNVYGVKDDIASIIGAHHGKPIDNRQIINKQLKERIINYYQTTDTNNSIYKKWDTAQRNFFDWALKTSCFDKIEKLPKITQPTAVLLSGLLIIADWIASNEIFFPLLDIEEIEVENSDRRFENGILKWYKSTNLSITSVNPSEEFYISRFNFTTPNIIQKTIQDIIRKADEPGIVILEAMMGKGKTEAALIAAEELFCKTGRSGLAFCLPTQATSNGMFPRIKKWLETLSKLEENQNSNFSIHLAHGKAALNEEFMSLSRNIDIDSSENGGVIVNEWFSGRKTTNLDDFVVGTVDQFLLLALRQKHLALRHLGFSKKVVVIDEVHSYDAYMSVYLMEALKWMGAYKVPVIILSATLSVNVRTELIKNYMAGCGLKWKEVTKPEELSSYSYPIITYTDGSYIKVANNFPMDKTYNKEVKIIKINRIRFPKRLILDDKLSKKEKEQKAKEYKKECKVYEFDACIGQIMDLLTELYKNEGVIGIILNTVRETQEIARRCFSTFGENSFELLHSNFIATDRVDRENKIIDLIGKGAVRPNRKIIIGTQVIEQSLDLDFDVLITDICPIDLLLQRIGRLHRHNIKRCSAYRKPKVYVVGTDNELQFSAGTEVVYNPYILIRSQYFLKDTISLPSDISALVQKVYKEDEKGEAVYDIELKEELKKYYEMMKSKSKEELKEKEENAKTYRLKNPKLKDYGDGDNTLIGWLEEIIPTDTEERGYARVRDTENTIEVIALKKVGNGYGTFKDEIDISDNIKDYAIAKNISAETLRLPLVISKYSFDDTVNKLEEYNIKNLRKWQTLPWLKGNLGIIFDEENSYILGDYKLTYDKNYGLLYEKLNVI